MYAAAVSISHTHTQNLYRFIFLSVFIVSIGITLGFCYCKDNNNFCISQKILLNFCKVGIVPCRQSFRVSQNKVFDGFFNGIENVVLVPE